MKLVGLLFNLLLASAAASLRTSSASLSQDGEANGQSRGLQDEASGGSITQIVAARDGFQTLATALSLTGLDRLFDCRFGCWWSHFTVFAPTNDAFDALPDGVLDKLTTRDDYKIHLASILGYHAINGRVEASAIIDAQGTTVSRRSLQGQLVNATFVDPDVVINDNAKVIDPDIAADNGIIHSIDQVLLPSFATQTIGDLATAAGLTSLATALSDNNLLDTFTDPTSTFTVFAPTNEAFAAFTEAFPNADAATVARVLQYHVVPDAVVFSRDIVPGTSTPTLLENESIEFVRKPGFGFRGKFRLNGDTDVESANNLAINGVVHVIDKVLLPSDLRDATPSGPDLVQLAMNNDNIFSSLIAALVRADLVTTLQGEGPFTVFAPTNTAFRNALADLGFASLDDIPVNTLTTILLYHVVPNTRAFFRNLEDNSELPTASSDAGDTIAVTLNRFWLWVTGATLNGSARVIGRDAEATNGVIHVIDEVLLPPSLNL